MAIRLTGHRSAVTAHAGRSCTLLCTVQFSQYRTVHVVIKTHNCVVSSRAHGAALSHLARVAALAPPVCVALSLH